MALANCQSLSVSAINYAGCDGAYELNPEGGAENLHWTKKAVPFDPAKPDGRQLWWCDHQLADVSPHRIRSR
jgi:hypothetical protein